MNLQQAISSLRAILFAQLDVNMLAVLLSANAMWDMRQVKILPENVN